MVIFLDTGFYVGLVHSKDEHHAQSKAILNRAKTGTYGRLYTSSTVMIETSTLAGARSGNDPRVINNVRRYFLGDLTLADLLRPNAMDDERTWDLFQKVNTGKQEKTISFIDCSSIILCQRYQIEQIATYDGHFEGRLQKIS